MSANGRMTPETLGVRHAYADVNGIRMHYVEKGAAGAPLVVMCHGFPEMWWSWRYQIAALTEAGFRVVAPDMRGYNETDAKGPYDIDTLRDDVVALLDHLRAPKAIIVSHDWGGGVAWHLASTRPERVEKLVVMNCPHPAVFMRALIGSRGQIKWSQIKRSWYMFFFQLPFIPEQMLTASAGQGVVRVLRANVLGTFLPIKYTLPYMVKRKSGKIVNISGTSGLRGYRYRTAYSASKWAVRGVTRTVALDVGEYNINVNVVCPGIVDGPRMNKLCEEKAKRRGWSFERVYEEYVDDMALKRVTQAQDIANAVLFLASEESRQLTGHEIAVDGGWDV